MEERGLGKLLWARLVRLVTLRLVLAILATDSFHRYHSLGLTPFQLPAYHQAHGRTVAALTC